MNDSNVRGARCYFGTADLDVSDRQFKGFDEIPVRNADAAKHSHTQRRDVDKVSEAPPRGSCSYEPNQRNSGMNIDEADDNQEEYDAYGFGELHSVVRGKSYLCSDEVAGKLYSVYWGVLP